MEKGKINVQTENIFPIIKKFLYSDHEIFLREIVSNAVDATQKLKTLSSLNDINGDLGDLTVEILADKEAKTLTIRDKGIGMTAEEVEKYISQIAFSSAEEFVEKYKGKSENDVNAIIGHFGLGFYSAFMVSEKVEIFTKTYKKGKGTKAVHWDCDGETEYTIEEIETRKRGTDIVLHITDENKEFLEEWKINELLSKYCKFLPVPIKFGTETIQEADGEEKDKEGNQKTKDVVKDRIINNPDPAWKKKPVDLSEEDYQSFYGELYPHSIDKPLFSIHLNVDYPFNLTGILYFPKLKNNLEVQKNKIQLYSNQVFVTDSVEGIVPDFLTLLHGVLDSPDIPLNVSRSYLQSDRNVKRISKHITKKVASKLEEMFKEDRENFEKKWDDIRVFIQYGIISDPSFAEKAEKFTLLKNTEGKYFTLEEYKEQISALQTDKEDKLIYLYTSDIVAQHDYIARAKQEGYDVIILDGVLDSHFAQTLEQKNEKTAFVRVDSDTIDKLIQKDEERPSKLNDEEKEALKPIITEVLNKSMYLVNFENLSETDRPMIITQNEFMRRMKDMQRLQGGGGMDFPDSYNLVVNSNHPAISSLLNIDDEDKKKDTIKHLCDLALLSQNLLTGQDLTDFIDRTISQID